MSTFVTVVNLLEFQKFKNFRNDGKNQQRVMLGATTRVRRLWKNKREAVFYALEK